MANSEKNVQLSSLFYDYLCEIVGSEEKVRARRQFFSVYDDANNSHPMTQYISSGSKSEGLDLPGSDFDLMEVLEYIDVFENVQDQQHYIKGCTSYLILDTIHANPGFCLLKIPKIPANEKLIETYGVETEHGTVVSNKLLKEIHGCTGLNFIHGPCLSDFNGEFDYALCFHCKTWISVAKNWIMRPTQSGWPSACLKSDIVKEGVLFVPIGSKGKSPEGCPLEWRISFSVGEKKLIYSFNHTQLLCYSLLKIILKEVINQIPSVSNILCSYHLKTCLFWVLEEIHADKFEKGTLIKSFFVVFERLIYYISIGMLPNYFLPECNLFESKIDILTQEILIPILKQCRKQGWHIFLRCLSLRGFADIYIVKRSELKATKSIIDFNCAVFPLVYIFNFFTFDSISPVKYIHKSLEKCISNIIRKKHSFRKRSLYLLNFVHFNHHLQQLYTINIFAENKKQYSVNRQKLPHILISTQTDAVSGWIELASVFYQNRQFRNVLHIADFALSECTPDKTVIENSKLKSGKISLITQNVNYATNSINKLLKITTVMLNRNSKFLTERPSEIKDPIKMIRHINEIKIPNIVTSPLVIVHTLRAMSFHYLCNTKERQRALDDMKLTVRDKTYVDTLHDRLMLYIYLAVAYDIMHDKKQFLYWMSEIKKIMG